MKAVLIIDDFFGRIAGAGEQMHRRRLSQRLHVEEIHEADEESISGHGAGDEVRVMFFRGQRPVNARVGDMVENDLPGTLVRISEGVPGSGQPWDLILLDLCFNTGRVTPRSHRDFPGMPEVLSEERLTNKLFGLEILANLSRQAKPPAVAIFSAIDEREIQGSIAGFKFVVGWLPRIDPEGDVKLRQLLAQGLTVKPTAIVTFDQLVDGMLGLRFLPSDTLSAPLTTWKNASAVVTRELLLWAFSNAGRRSGAPALLSAMKLLTGNGELTTSKAADLLKRLVRENDSTSAIMLNEPVIAEAYQKAIRLRGAKVGDKPSEE